MPDLWMDVDTALSEVPVNIAALIDNTDFVSREESVAYNAAGMDLVWNFVTTAGAFTQTAVTPTTGGDYDWTNQGNGFYSIEIPASGGASINNDTEGVGWFAGVATGVMPWRGPTIGFRSSGVNDVFIDGAIPEMAQAAPPATPDLDEILMYLYMSLRNKIDVTASVKEFHNDSGTVIWKKTLSDNGTTYSEAEGVTGP